MPAHGARPGEAPVTLRTFLFVPGDRPDRMRKALASGADAIILDLEDSVAEANKAAARLEVSTFVREYAACAKIFVRINALERGLLERDLHAALHELPFGIMLPKAEGPGCVAQVAERLAGTGVRLLPVVTETPRALFRLGDYGDVAPSLYGLTWGAEDLSASVGAVTARQDDGRYRPAYELARSLTLFGAHAARVPAIETIYPNFSDLDGLAVYARRGCEDGFSGMMAIHPRQIPVIQAAFRPGERALERARRIVALFASDGARGAMNLDGEMVDAPHLAEARRLLAQATNDVLTHKGE
jgi:citrate lyase subunit beta / citryl-CoA lyase